MKCQQQGKFKGDVGKKIAGDGLSCGVYAFVFAVLLAFNKNPSEVTFQIEAMRTYMINCLREKTILDFPEGVFATPRKNKFWRCKTVSKYLI